MSLFSMLRRRRGHSLRRRYGHQGAVTEGHVNRVPGRLYYVDGKGNVLSKPMKHR